MIQLWREPERAAVIPLYAGLLLASCAQYAIVSEIKPPQRAGFSAPKSESLTALGKSIPTAESAWSKLDADPGNAVTRRDYKYAGAGIWGTLRAAKLAPWRAPIRVGARTVAWNRDLRPESNPALYEITSVDQLKIHGTYVDERETKEGLGAPLGRESH